MNNEHVMCLGGKKSANIFGWRVHLENSYAWRVSALHAPDTTGENTPALQEKSESFRGELTTEAPVPMKF